MRGRLAVGNVITHPNLLGMWLVVDIDKSTDPTWEINFKYKLHPIDEASSGAELERDTIWAELSNIFTDTVKLHPPAEVTIVGDCVRKWEAMTRRHESDRPFAPTETVDEECAHPF